LLQVQSLKALKLPLSGQAELLIADAFKRLCGSVSPEDAREFNNTTLDDVCTAARDIEKRLAAKSSLRDMGRLRPFFNGLKQYSKVMEILCNDTSFLPWIWVS
jgi:hypothetical protein